MHHTQLISHAIEAIGSNSVTVFDEEVDIASLSAHQLNETLALQCTYYQEQMGSSEITEENDVDNLVCQQVRVALVNILECGLLVDIQNAKLSQEREERLTLRIAEKSDASFIVPPLWNGCLHRFMQDRTYTHSWMHSSSSTKRHVPSINLGDVSREVSIAVAKARLDIDPMLENHRSRKRSVVNKSFHHSQLSTIVLIERILPIKNELDELASKYSTALQGGDESLAESLRHEKDDALHLLDNVLLSLGIDDNDILSTRRLLLSTDKVFCVKQKLQQEMIKTKKKKKVKKTKTHRSRHINKARPVSHDKSTVHSLSPDVDSTTPSYAVVPTDAKACTSGRSQSKNNRRRRSSVSSQRTTSVVPVVQASTPSVVPTVQEPSCDAPDQSMESPPSDTKPSVSCAQSAGRVSPKIASVKIVKASELTEEDADEMLNIAKSMLHSDPSGAVLICCKVLDVFPESKRASVIHKLAVQLNSSKDGVESSSVESSESSTANIAVDESLVETLVNTGVARSDLVADVGDLVAEDESSSIVLSETSEGSKPITVFVKQLVGNDYHQIEILDNSPVAKLKDAIYHLEAVPSNIQRLIFCGKDLEDDCTLSQASIANESTVDLLLRGAVVGGLPGGSATEAEVEKVASSLYMDERNGDTEYKTWNQLNKSGPDDEVRQIWKANARSKIQHKPNPWKKSPVFTSKRLARKNNDVAMSSSNSTAAVVTTDKKQSTLSSITTNVQRQASKSKKRKVPNISQTSTSTPSLPSDPAFNINDAVVTKNLPPKYRKFNGTIGKVTDIDDETGCVVIQTVDGKRLGLMPSYLDKLQVANEVSTLQGSLDGTNNKPNSNTSSGEDVLSQQSSKANRISISPQPSAASLSSSPNDTPGSTSSDNTATAPVAPCPSSQNTPGSENTSPNTSTTQTTAPPCQQDQSTAHPDASDDEQTQQGGAAFTVGTEVVINDNSSPKYNGLPCVVAKYFDDEEHKGMLVVIDRRYGTPLRVPQENLRISSSSKTREEVASDLSRLGNNLFTYSTESRNADEMKKLVSKSINCLKLSFDLNSSDITANCLDKSRQQHKTLVDISSGKYSKAIESITAMIVHDEEGPPIESDASIALSCVLKSVVSSEINGRGQLPEGTSQWSELEVELGDILYALNKLTSHPSRTGNQLKKYNASKMNRSAGGRTKLARLNADRALVQASQSLRALYKAKANVINLKMLTAERPVDDIVSDLVENISSNTVAERDFQIELLGQGGTASLARKALSLHTTCAEYTFDSSETVSEDDVLNNANSIVVNCREMLSTKATKQVVLQFAWGEMSAGKKAEVIDKLSDKFDFCYKVNDDTYHPLTKQGTLIWVRSIQHASNITNQRRGERANREVLNASQVQVGSSDVVITNDYYDESPGKQKMNRLIASSLQQYDESSDGGKKNIIASIKADFKLFVRRCTNNTYEKRVDSEINAVIRLLLSIERQRQELELALANQTPVSIGEIKELDIVVNEVGRLAVTDLSHVGNSVLIEQLNDEITLSRLTFSTTSTLANYAYDDFTSEGRKVYVKDNEGLCRELNERNGRRVIKNALHVAERNHKPSEKELEIRDQLQAIRSDTTTNDAEKTTRTNKVFAKVVLEDDDDEDDDDTNTGTGSSSISKIIMRVLARRVQSRHYQYERYYLRAGDFKRAVGIGRVHFAKSLILRMATDVTMSIDQIITPNRKEQLHIEHIQALANKGKTPKNDRWNSDEYYMKWNWTNMWLGHAMNNWRMGTKPVDGWEWDENTKRWLPESDEWQELVKKCIEKFDLYKY